MNEIDNPYYRAAYSKFVAEQDEAVANLLTLFNRPVGIGEHPQIIDEMVEQTRSLAEAEDCLERLADTFEVKEETSAE